MRSLSLSQSISRRVLTARTPVSPAIIQQKNATLVLRRPLSSSSSSSGGKPAAATTTASPASAAAAAVPQSTAGTGLQNPGFFYFQNKSPVSWTSLFIAGVASASAVAYYRIERERRLESAMGKVVSTGKPAIGGPWSLIDLEGNIVTEQSFVGKWTLLYFGFARCPDICPSEMQKVARVMDTLKQKHPELYKKVVPLFVSVDPARDSIQVLKDYAKDFHPDYVFLTGSPTQVQQMAKKYRVYVSKADESEDGEDYLVDHSIVIYFHDDAGELSDCFTQSMRASDVVEKVVEKMNYKPKN